MSKVNNIEIIKPLLKWDSEDDFYFLQVIQRKKDHKKGKVNGTNNNSRQIKFYCIRNLDHLNFIMPEVIELCNIFQARAGINLNRRSYKNLSLKLQMLILKNVENGHYNKMIKAYSTVCGRYPSKKDKSWIIDVDKEELPFLEYIKKAINDKKVQPEGNKIITEIPSKTGLHLITKPFNRVAFKDELDTIMSSYSLPILKRLEIQANNPTNLYIP